MLVDLARGGWRPEPYRRGIWLFPPVEGAFAWSAVEDAGDGAAPVTRWSLTGRADTDEIHVQIHRDGAGVLGDAKVTILLPPGETRRLSVDRGGGEPVTVDGRDGVTLTLA